jgi:chemotaxis signal transduction protein
MSTADVHRALCLVFRTGSERVAIKSGDVQKVTVRPHVSRLPRLPAHVLGIAQHRGRVVTIVDAGAALFPGAPAVSAPPGDGREPHDPRSEERLLILERPARHVGLLVDGVVEIETLHLPPDLPEGPSPSLRLAHHKGRAIAVVDIERLARTIGATVEPGAPRSRGPQTE